MSDQLTNIPPQNSAAQPDTRHRPNCRRCGTRMMLMHVQHVVAANHDRRTFECANCGDEIPAVVQFK